MSHPSRLTRLHDLQAKNNIPLAGDTVGGLRAKGNAVLRTPWLLRHILGGWGARVLPVILGGRGIRKHGSGTVARARNDASSPWYCCIPTSPEKRSKVTLYSTKVQESKKGCKSRRCDMQREAVPRVGDHAFHQAVVLRAPTSIPARGGLYTSHMFRRPNGPKPQV